MKKFSRHLFLFSFIVFSSTALYSKTLSSFDQSTIELLKTSQISHQKLNSNDLAKLVDIAKKRLTQIQASLTKPNLFFQFLLPAEITRNLPYQIQPYLEKEITNLEGIIEVREIMLPNHGETLQYVLHRNQDIYYLNFLDTPPDELQTDAKVVIKKAFEIPINSHAKELVLASDSLTILQKVRALPLSFGPQPTITMLVNFSDNRSQPWTLDYIKNMVFTQINNFYLEASYGQTSIVGDAYGWFALNLPSTTPCADLPNQMEQLADQAAKNAGIDLTKYKRKLYVFPKTSSCSWSGLGTVGGTNTRAFVNGSMSSILVAAHELGHNIGLRHAQALRCASSPIEGSCTESEYGDGSDTMGNSNPGHFNAFQKDRLGWLNYQSSPPITTVTQSGSYFIDAYETKNSRPKALKVLKRAGDSTYYYLEFRQGIGFDKVLETCSNCDFTKGIVFHQGNPTTSTPSQLLDMSPGGGNQLVALLPCQSWKDPGAPQGGVTFTVQSVSPQGARVLVTYGGLTEQCQRQTPSVTVLPRDTRWLRTNETETYSVLIKNNDNKKCSARDFSVTSMSIAPYLNVTANNKSFRVMPGSSQVLKVSLTSNYKGVPFIQSAKLFIQDSTHSPAIIVPIHVGLHQS